MSAKLERLLNLTAILLQTTVPLSAEDLRTKVEGYPDAGAAFRRSFERDKDDIRNLGIPLEVARVPGTDPPLDGYRIRPENYYLADPGLEADELAALHLASTVIRLTSEDNRSAIWKLGGVPDDELGEVEALASIPLDPSLGSLFAAVTARCAVRFDYGLPQATPREVEPWRLDFQRGRWYLSGFDRTRRAERNFRLDRIDGPVSLLEGSESEFGSPVAPRVHQRPVPGWRLGEAEPELVTIDVDDALVPHVRAELGPEAKEWPSERGARFEVGVANWAAFRSFVLGLLNGAEVVAPANRRADMVSWLTNLAGQQ